MEKFISGININLRDVKVSDAEFILALRTNEDKNKFLHKTDNDLNKQIDYINAYKEKINEWYFLIETKDKKQIGTIRIYDVIGDDFCWGSWLITNEALITAALESALLIYEYAFYTLGFNRVHFDVRKGNEKVAAFHKSFGAKIMKESDTDYFFTYSKEDYEFIRPKYCKFLKYCVNSK
ncbi:MAG: GNAT family N-acetyltransferase [Endomicrobium sp.]|jgi:RimJ/RimL family protein N-acetyltransferase|nr:GNAT family N-acetyltransferase [Endomicrobium sp.]